MPSRSRPEPGLPPVDPALPPRPWLTPDEVSARLGVARGTLNNWRSLGLGPVFIRIGGVGSVRYPIAKLLEWEAAQLK